MDAADQGAAVHLFGGQLLAAALAAQALEWVQARLSADRPVVIAASAPGRSCAAILSRAIRPHRTSSRTSTLASKWVSILPPHSTVPILRPW